LDESTVTETQAQITKLCTRRFTNVYAKAILSGLPNPEGPLDYFEQLRFLHGYFLGFINYWKFRDRYFTQVDYDWIPKDGTEEMMRDYVHKNAFILSRKQAGIGPGKIYEKRYITPNPKQLKVIREVEADFAYTGTTSTVLTKWISVQQVMVARIAGGYDTTGDIRSDAKT
jgi:hypothetical protein